MWRFSRLFYISNPFQKKMPFWQFLPMEKCHWRSRRLSNIDLLLSEMEIQTSGLHQFGMIALFHQNAAIEY
jgi:hypothetical protein